MILLFVITAHCLFYY